MANGTNRTDMTVIAQPSPQAKAALTPAEADASGRGALLLLWLGAVGWLVVASVCQLLSSVQLHAPSFLADSAWLTHGRMQTASVQAWVYGFGLSSGLGAALWLLVRLGRSRLEWPVVAGAGAVLGNVAVLIGVLRILAGEGTGYEGFEFPPDAALLLFVAYGLVGSSALETLRCRHGESLHPSQWYLLAALFWLPWVYSTAALVLWVMPARGILQAVVVWWYVGNLVHVWFVLVGLAVLLYLVPALTNRPLQGLGHVRMAFWLLVVLGGWRGMPPHAPLPAWMPAVSTVASVLSLVPLLAVTIALGRTFVGGGGQAAAETPENTERHGSTSMAGSPSPQPSPPGREGGEGEPSVTSECSSPTPPSAGDACARQGAHPSSSGGSGSPSPVGRERDGVRGADARRGCPETGRTRPLGAPRTSSSETALAAPSERSPYLSCVVVSRNGKEDSWEVGGCALSSAVGPLCLVIAATTAYAAAGLLSITAAVPEVNRVTAFTLFERGWARLFLGGFFGLTAFAAMYVIWPRLLAGGLPSLALVRIHLWGTVVGVAFQAIPLLVGGVAQGLLMNDPHTAFLDALQPGLMALRISTLGDVMVTAATAALAANLVWGLGRWGRRVGQSILAEALRPEDAEVER